MTNHPLSAGDRFCNLCISLMESASAATGLSYGEINVLLFVIFGPLSTLCFMASAIFARRGKRLARIITITASVIGACCVLAMLAILAIALIHRA